MATAETIIIILTTAAIILILLFFGALFWFSPQHQLPPGKMTVRAFVAEVERRATQLALANGHGVPHDPNFVDYSEAFDAVKRELLGEK